MRILIVDDEQLVRWFLERALRKWGYEVVAAPNIQEAIRLIDNNKFDILFTDLRMPEGNGTRIIKRVSELPENIKIVVCSAFITPDMAEEFKARGIVTLKKPFKLSELENALSLCVD
ncbi:MAG: response regulator [Thermodesulfovibrionales bacterium]|nr:response regulator [Thermodesulfovibrionales bacterium]